MRWALRALVLLLVLGMLVPVPACRRRPQQQVVLYVSADEHIARQVIDRFQQQTGISVKVVGDTEAKKTTGLVERLRGEKASPQADVFWSSEISQTIALADEGALDEHLSDATKDWPREWRDGQRRWFAFAARPLGRQAAGAIAVVGIIGALSIFSLRTMVEASFERGDVPKDLLIYTQSSPAIPKIATQIDQLAAATGLGYDMPIAVDSDDSFSWPWAWYLRDYKRVSYVSFANGMALARHYLKGFEWAR